MTNKLVNFNGGTITLGQIPKAIELSEATKRSLLLQSAPGYGKSAMVYQYGEQKGYKVFSFTGGLLSKSNIYGVDFIDSENKSCQHYVADWYNQAINHNGKVILFLDDLGNAPPQEMMLLQQILGDRKLGNYSLPTDKFLIIGCTNRQNDRANVFSISSAILSRCCVIQVRLDPEEFLTYAKDNLHPSVYSFLKMRKYAISNDSDYLEENPIPSDLTGFYKASSSANSISPCPRTWEGVSHMLYKMQKNVLSDEYIDVFSNCVSGYVGNGITPIFIKSLKGTLNIPSIDTLVQNCKPSFDYTTIISSDNEALSSIIFTIYQEINKRLQTFKQLKEEGKLEEQLNSKGLPYYDYPPIVELADVLNKIGKTNFNSVNSNVLVNDLWDLLISNKSSIYHEEVMDTLFCLDYLKEFQKIKTEIKNSL